MSDRVFFGLIATACVIGIIAGGLIIYEKAPRITCFNIPYIYSGCGVVK
jgi:hypothetical protein